jgi:tetratricopeptide (TPR) repeat protein
VGNASFANSTSTGAIPLRLKKLYGQAAEKYREAIAVDPDYPNAYNSLGRALAAQELFEEAIGQYGKADALWQKAGSSDRKFALTNTPSLDP